MKTAYDGEFDFATNLIQLKHFQFATKSFLQQYNGERGCRRWTNTLRITYYKTAAEGTTEGSILRRSQTKERQLQVSRKD